MSPVNHAGLGGNVVSKDELYVSPLFDLFTKGPEEKSGQASRVQKYYPITPLTDDGPFEFRFSTSPMEFLYAPLIRLGGSLKMMKGNQNISQADDVSVCNLPIDSIFKSVTVELNTVKIEDTSYMYCYKSFLEKSLSFGADAKKTHLLNDIFYEDTPDKHDNVSR